MKVTTLHIAAKLHEQIETVRKFGPFPNGGHSPDPDMFVCADTSLIAGVYVAYKSCAERPEAIHGEEHFNVLSILNDQQCAELRSKIANLCEDALQDAITKFDILKDTP